MKKLKTFFKNAEAIKSAVIFILLAITALLFAAMFSAQNIKSESAERGGSVETIIKNPADIDDESITTAFWEYTSPEYIVLNKDGNRDILYSGTDRYAEICDGATDIIRGMYNGITDQTVLSDASVWQKMLSVNSVLLHFPAYITPEFQMQFLGLSESPITENIDTFSDILIVTGLPDQKYAVLYIKEAKTERIVRFETKLPIKELNGVISDMESVTDKNYAFGFELKLDRISGSSTTISSMLTIPLVNIETAKIEARVPENFSQKLREVGQNELSTNVLSIFGCDPQTVRSYTDTENSRILLANDRRIVLSSDGIIEFQTDKSSGGVDISGGSVITSSNSLYIAISGTFKTILGMLEITGTDIKSADWEIKLTEMSCSEDYLGEVRLSFDYYIGGHVMKYIDDPSSHAIEAVISNGRLTSFKMELKNFVKTCETVSNKQMITAIDEYCKKHSEEDSIYIYDSYLYYGYKKNNENMQTVWAVN